MKNKVMIKLLIIILILLIMPLGNNLIDVFALSPYITQTYNRYNELVLTQDAYEPIEKIKKIENGKDKLVLNRPKDLFIDEEDYLYIADTGNKRIIILDKDHNFILCFGDDDKRLSEPRGIFVRDNLIYIADYGQSSDNDSGRIFIYEFDRKIQTVNFVKELNRPTSPILDIDNFRFRPEKIGVDKYHTMYVVVEGSYNGLLLINQENRFLSFFSPNEIKLSWQRRLIKFFYGDNEEALINKDLPAPPYNVWIDNSGYIYTVTQTVVQNAIGDTLKKVNVGGINYFPAKMHASGDFVSAVSGSVQNVYAVTKNGFIHEYDNEGNLLFVFSGKASGADQLGLFSSASAIQINSLGNLYILDDNDHSFQIFRPTQFANKVHQALSLYNDGKYIESKEYWEDVLHYNAMFDLAHKGIGLAFFLENDFHQALDKFAIANAKNEYSEAFWEIRNIWLVNNASSLMISLILIALLIIVIKILKRKTTVFAWIDGLGVYVKKHKPLKDFLSMFSFIKKPLDTSYYFKTDKTIKFYHGLFYLIILFAIYLLGLTKTGFLFNNVIIERTILLKEAFKIIIPIIAFVIANYLTSSLIDGEGSFKAIFLTTMASLTPIILLYPGIIIISNFLTYNESFIYSFGLILMIGWSAVLLFIVNKELHNYSIKRNFLNFLITLLLMIVLIIVVILIYLIIAQVVSFISDLITEVIFHG